MILNIPHSKSYGQDKFTGILHLFEVSDFNDIVEATESFQKRNSVSEFTTISSTTGFTTKDISKLQQSTKESVAIEKKEKYESAHHKPSEPFQKFKTYVNNHKLTNSHVLSKPAIKDDVLLEPFQDKNLNEKLRHLRETLKHKCSTEDYNNFFEKLVEACLRYMDYSMNTQNKLNEKFNVYPSISAHSDEYKNNQSDSENPTSPDNKKNEPRFEKPKNINVKIIENPKTNILSEDPSEDEVDPRTKIIEDIIAKLEALQNSKAQNQTLHEAKKCHVCPLNTLSPKDISELKIRKQLASRFKAKQLKNTASIFNKKEMDDTSDKVEEIKTFPYAPKVSFRDFMEKRYLQEVENQNNYEPIPIRIRRKFAKNTPLENDIKYDPSLLKFYARNLDNDYIYQPVYNRKSFIPINVRNRRKRDRVTFHAGHRLQPKNNQKSPLYVKPRKTNSFPLKTRKTRNLQSEDRVGQYLQETQKLLQELQLLEKDFHNKQKMQATTHGYQNLVNVNNSEMIQGPSTQSQPNFEVTKLLNLEMKNQKKLLGIQTDKIINRTNHKQIEATPVVTDRVQKPFTKIEKNNTPQHIERNNEYQYSEENLAVADILNKPQVVMFHIKSSTFYPSVTSSEKSRMEDNNYLSTTISYEISDYKENQARKVNYEDYNYNYDDYYEDYIANRLAEKMNNEIKKRSIHFFPNFGTTKVCMLIFMFNVITYFNGALQQWLF